MEFEHIFLQVFTFIIWVAALWAFIIQVKEHPKVYQKERVLYSFAIISYIVHVLIFYGVLFIRPFRPEIDMEVFRLWSNMLRIHGGFALLFKEIAAIIRIRLFNKKGSTDE